MKPIFSRSLLFVYRLLTGKAEKNGGGNPASGNFPGKHADTKVILEATSSMVAIIDNKARYIYVSPSHERALGYTPEELLGKTGFDLVHPEDMNRLSVLFAKSLSGEIDKIKPLTYRAIHKNGQIRYIQASFDSVRDKSGQLEKIIAVGDDITEQEKTSMALHQSQQRYQAMFNNLSAGVAIFKPVDNGRDFIIIDFNKTAEQIENTSREAVIGKKVSDAFPGVKSFGLFAVFQRVNETGCPEQHPVTLYHDDRISSWRRNYVYKLPGDEIVAVYLDETERVRAEDALTESEARFRSLVEYSSDHVFMLTSDGEYLFSNDRQGQHGSSRKDSLIGKKLEEAHSPELAARFRRLVAHVFKNGNVTSFEHEEKTPEGPAVYLNTLYPIYKDGKQWAVGGISREITTRKRYEQELQQKTQELEKTVNELRQTQRRVIDQERQRALSQMASGIAHDFNNSLTSIQGFSDLLLQIPEKMNDPKTVKDYITLINNSAREAAQIVRRLRKFYRPSENEKVETIDINRLIDEVAALTKPIWKSNAQARGIFITIEKELEPQAAVCGNRTELHEVITNLIFNAVDAMPKGGVIRIVTRREGDRITLAIGDTGIGMDTDVLRQCLNPFFTTKGESGSGLGLATVQGIITRHQGQIDIQSRPGQGTTFILRLPAATFAGEAAMADEPAKQTSAALKILVVDDNDHQRLLLQKYLQKDNHLTETAVDGVDGMRKFNDGWFDLVITDHAMPELNGDDLARSIKKATPDKPVIMLTGFGDMMEAVGEKPESIDLMISKPVSLEQLREAIRQVFSGKTGNRGT